MILKNCNKCKQEKELTLSNFRQCKYSSGELYFKAICRACEVKNSLKYNKNYVKTDEQKNRFKEYKKQWKILNKETINKKYRDRCINDINFRIRKNVSRAINRALTKMSMKKDTSILNHLGYSILDLKKYLENQFDNKMSWDNYGIYWHIDHIIPQSCLPYKTMQDENFKKCWALQNLRPLDAKSNMLDGSTRIRHKMYNNLFNGVI